MTTVLKSSPLLSMKIVILILKEPSLWLIQKPIKDLLFRLFNLLIITDRTWLLCISISGISVRNKFLISCIHPNNYLRTKWKGVKRRNIFNIRESCPQLTGLNLKKRRNYTICFMVMRWVSKFTPAESTTLPFIAIDSTCLLIQQI